MTVLDFGDYKKYLSIRLKTSGELRGTRSKLAAYLQCQTAHISQVLRGDGHFSLEHAAQINEFLEHSQDESEYFILLLQKERSGNRSLTKHFERRMAAIQAGRQRAKIAAAKPMDTTTSSDLVLYYTSWQISAVHIALMRKSQTASELERILGLSAVNVQHALTTLLQLRLIRGPEEHQYQCLPERIHLPPDSPIVGNHHSNWRMRTIQKIDQGQDPASLHYSGPMAISKQSALQIRQLLVKSIEGMEHFINLPGEEELCTVCIDFYKFSQI